MNTIDLIAFIAGLIGVFASAAPIFNYIRHRTRARKFNKFIELPDSIFTRLERVKRYDS